MQSLSTVSMFALDALFYCFSSSNIGLRYERLKSVLVGISQTKRLMEITQV